MVSFSIPDWSSERASLAWQMHVEIREVDGTVCPLHSVEVLLDALLLRPLSVPVVRHSQTTE